MVMPALGTCEHVHPDVIHVPGGFAGFEYWLAFTPYPRGDDRQENPCVRASHDGYTWQRLPVATDPLVQPPAAPSSHHADPELVYADGRLHLVFMTRNRELARTTFSVMSTADGVQWTQPVTFYENVTGVSPSVLVEAGAWVMWSIHVPPGTSPATSKTLRHSGPDLFNLHAGSTCEMHLDGFLPWHLDVIRTGRGYEALVAAYPVGTDNSRTRLFHMESSDGVVFRQSEPGALIRASRFGWDSRMVYRSTFLRSADGWYRIWYSASNWARHYGIGYLEGPITRLSPSLLGSPEPLHQQLGRVLIDTWYHLRALGRWMLPRRALAVYSRWRQR